MALSRTKATILGGYFAFRQAHWKADEFVQGVSNPFTKAIGKFIDPLAAKRDAGTMTYEDAFAANEGIEDLIEDYTAASTEFSAKGKDHKKVVDQGWQTVNPYIADWRKTLAADLARLKPPDPAEEFAPPPDDPPDKGTILTGREEAKKAATQQRKRSMRQGRASTILTGPGGVKGAAPGRPQTILGY